MVPHYPKTKSVAFSVALLSVLYENISNITSLNSRQNEWYTIIRPSSARKSLKAHRGDFTVVLSSQDDVMSISTTASTSSGASGEDISHNSEDNELPAGADTVDLESYYFDASESASRDTMSCVGAAEQVPSGAQLSIPNIDVVAGFSPVRPQQKSTTSNRSNSTSGLGSCLPKTGRKGSWMEEEDECLRYAYERHAHREGTSRPQSGVWSKVQSDMKRFGRIAKQCRERWTNHLAPGLKKGKWEREEDWCIRDFVVKNGAGHWAAMSKLPCLKGRTDNAIKNRYNSSIKQLMNDSSSLKEGGDITGVGDLTDSARGTSTSISSCTSKSASSSQADGCVAVVGSASAAGKEGRKRGRRPVGSSSSTSKSSSSSSSSSEKKSMKKRRRQGSFSGEVGVNTFETTGFFCTMDGTRADACSNGQNTSGFSQGGSEEENAREAMRRRLMNFRRFGSIDPYEFAQRFNDDTDRRQTDYVIAESQSSSSSQQTSAASACYRRAADDATVYYNGSAKRLVSTIRPPITSQQSEELAQRPRLNLPPETPNAGGSSTSITGQSTSHNIIRVASSSDFQDLQSILGGLSDGSDGSASLGASDGQVLSSVDPIPLTMAAPRPLAVVGMTASTMTGRSFVDECLTMTSPQSQSLVTPEMQASYREQGQRVALSANPNTTGEMISTI